MPHFFVKIKKTGNNLSFQQGNPQVFSAHWSLTSVFGMGTGISSMSSSPENYMCKKHTQKYIDENLFLRILFF